MVTFFANSTMILSSNLLCFSRLPAGNHMGDMQTQPVNKTNHIFNNLFKFY